MLEPHDRTTLSFFVRTNPGSICRPTVCCSGPGDTAVVSTDEMPVLTLHLRKKTVSQTLNVQEQYQLKVHPMQKIK